MVCNSDSYYWNFKAICIIDLFWFCVAIFTLCSTFSSPGSAASIILWPCTLLINGIRRRWAAYMIQIWMPEPRIIVHFVQQFLLLFQLQVVHLPLWTFNIFWFLKPQSPGWWWMSSVLMQWEVCIMHILSLESYFTDICWISSVVFILFSTFHLVSCTTHPPVKVGPYALRTAWEITLGFGCIVSLTNELIVQLEILNMFLPDIWSTDSVLAFWVRDRVVKNGVMKMSSCLPHRDDGEWFSTSLLEWLRHVLWHYWWVSDLFRS